MEMRWMTLGVCVLFLAGGCSNRGDDIAERMNEVIVKKIQSGEITNREQLKAILTPEKANELGIEDLDKPTTVAERESFLAAVEKYSREWEALLPDKGESGDP